MLFEFGIGTNARDAGFTECVTNRLCLFDVSKETDIDCVAASYMLGCVEVFYIFGEFPSKYSRSFFFYPEIPILLFELDGNIQLHSRVSFIDYNTSARNMIMSARR